MTDKIEQKIAQLAKDEESAAALQALFEEQQRKQAEAAFLEPFAMMFAAMNEGVVLQNAEGMIVQVNASAERILGLSFEQMTGRTSVDPRWRSIKEDGSPFAGKDHPAMVTLRTGQPQNNVIMGVHKPDGDLTWISVSSQPIFNDTADDPQEKPIAVVATFIDITEQQKQQAQNFATAIERERIRALADFIRNATHEFRNPLSLIRTRAYIMQRKYNDMIDAAEEFEQITNQVDEINRLINHLSLMSRLDERNSWTMTPIMIDPLLRGVVARYSEKFKGTLSLALTDESPKVFANQSVIVAAIEQILENAVTYTPIDGSITVETTIDEHLYIIKIQDTGIGMSPDVLSRATERFFRKDSGTIKAGFGLGLSIASRIMELHSGVLQIESTLGVGTTITLPLVLTSATKI